VGHKILLQQLKAFGRMEKLAQNLDVACRNGAAFSSVCSTIAQAKLAGLKGKTGYWTVNLARTFLPDLANIPWVGQGISMDPAGLELLLRMGEGSKACKLLGVDGKTSATTGPQMEAACRAVECVSRAAGSKRKCTPTQLVVMSCEAHRRGALVKTPRHVYRRVGL